MKLQAFTDGDGNKGYHHFCPGCNLLHNIWTSGKVAWAFNGNMDKPTFTPSVHHSTNKNTICHYNITAGDILFHEKSTHPLKSQRVGLPDIPKNFVS